MGRTAERTRSNRGRHHEPHRGFLRKSGYRLSSTGTVFFIALLLILAPGFSTPSRAVLVADQDYNLEAEGPRGPYHDSPVDPALNYLDVYIPDGGGSGLPVMIFVHGGSWCSGAKENTVYKDELFPGEGYVFVSVHYRLSPTLPDLEAPNRVMFPDHPHDVAEALRYVYDNIHLAGGDNQQIYLLGHSAGAHLVALVATDPSYLTSFGLPADVIKGVCALDTASLDIPARMVELPSDVLYNALGTPEENGLTGCWAAASPVLHADPADPPFFLVTQEGKDDRIGQNETLVAALARDPARVLITVPRSHSEINQDLGDPDDPSYITEAVLGFFDHIRTGAPCSDGDGDGYGDPASPACSNAAYDCNDGDPAVAPGSEEDCDNGVDDDCDGFVDDEDSECDRPGWGAASTASTSRPDLTGTRAVAQTCSLSAALCLPFLFILVLRGRLKRRDGRTT